MGTFAYQEIRNVRPLISILILLYVIGILYFLYRRLEHIEESFQTFSQRLRNLSLGRPDLEEDASKLAPEILTAIVVKLPDFVPPPDWNKRLEEPLKYRLERRDLGRLIRSDYRQADTATTSQSVMLVEVNDVNAGLALLRDLLIDADAPDESEFEICDQHPPRREPLIRIPG